MKDLGSMHSYPGCRFVVQDLGSSMLDSGFGILDPRQGSTIHYLDSRIQDPVSRSRNGDPGSPPRTLDQRQHAGCRLLNPDCRSLELVVMALWGGRGRSYYQHSCTGFGSCPIWLRGLEVAGAYHITKVVV
jgi:hypothetical protein